jgi:molybdate transport system substrate-binding protein
LRTHGLWDAIRPRLVIGDTIAQAAQFSTTGNAVGGLIAYSLVKEPGVAERGRYALIPQTDHAPLRQRMVLLKRATPVVEQFYAYMQGAAARTVLIRNGYQVPQ